MSILSLNELIENKRIAPVCFTAVLISLLDVITLSPVTTIHHQDQGEEEVQVNELSMMSAAFKALKTLAVNYTSYFDGTIQVVLRKLIRLNLPCDMMVALEDILSTLIIAMTMLQDKGYGLEAVACAQALLPHLKNTKTSKSAIKIMTPLISRIPSADLMVLLSNTSLISSLQRTLADGKSETRQATVMALAEVCLALGDIVYPLLSSSFSVNDMKLITIYAKSK
jgi:hypothetical protein